MKHLQGLAELESLELLRTKVDDEGLKAPLELTQLRELNLTKTDVTEAGLERLSELDNLRRLHRE